MGATKSDIIRALFAAYMSNDRKAVEESFSDDFRFTSPYDDRIDKASYFERCWRVGAAYQDGAFVKQQGGSRAACRTSTRRPREGGDPCTLAS